MPLDKQKTLAPASNRDIAQANLDIRAVSSLLAKTITAIMENDFASLPELKLEVLELNKKINEHFIELTGWTDDE